MKLRTVSFQSFITRFGSEMATWTLAATATRHWRVRLVIGAVLATVIVVCGGCQGGERVSEGERRAIADSLGELITEAYDFSKPGAPERLLGLYPDSGRIISAAAGRVSSTRQILETEIKGFWQNVGQNMRNPRFVLGSTYVDVITPNAAVMTLTYSIPHLTPAGTEHVVSGAWTSLWRRVDGRWMIVQEHLSDTPASRASPADTAGMAMPGMAMPGMTPPPLLTSPPSARKR